MSIITITVEATLLVSILFTVIYFEPINGLISIAFLLLFALLFFNSIKRKIKHGEIKDKKLTTYYLRMLLKDWQELKKF